MLQSSGGEPSGGTGSTVCQLTRIPLLLQSPVIGYILLPTAYPNTTLQMKYSNSGKVIFKSELKILQLLFLKIFLRTCCVCLWELCV